MDLLVPLLFFAVAFLYSMVGFGGGSSYLALLTFFVDEFQEIRSTALVLNITVVTIGTVLFLRHRVFDWKSFWPFLVTSIPLAYLGAQLRLTETTFFLLLGCLLMLTGLLMIFRLIRKHHTSGNLPRGGGLTIGGIIGFISGITGIGGGIYLAPTLHLLGWIDARKIAALASVFILANSLSGLSGLLLTGQFSIHGELLWKLTVAVALGGTLGSLLTNRKLDTSLISILTAALVMYVGIRLLWTS